MPVSSISPFYLEDKKPGSFDLHPAQESSDVTGFRNVACRSVYCPSIPEAPAMQTLFMVAAF